MGLLHGGGTGICSLTQLSVITLLTSGIRCVDFRTVTHECTVTALFSLKANDWIWVYFSHSYIPVLDWWGSCRQNRKILRSLRQEIPELLLLQTFSKTQLIELRYQVLFFMWHGNNGIWL